MSDFRTVVRVPSSDYKLGLGNTVFTVGSCFADHIGERLLTNKIVTQVNPFGTIFNPHSIHKLLANAALHGVPDDTSYLQHDEVFLNYDLHASFSALTQNDLEKKINKTISAANAFLKDVSCVLITYGTSFVYTRKDNQMIVANCHKQPANMFTKTLMTPEEILSSFDAVYHTVKTHNPSVQFIITVSPVRHLKDTIEMNSVSKSTLRLASHMIATKYTDVHYFPAYEIMVDDLRDYRFYKQDMIHPTTEAVDYIWEQFTNAYGAPAFLSFTKQWKEILAGMAHRPFHTGTRAHQAFLDALLRKLEVVSHLVNVDIEIKNVRDQKFSN